ncbi:hypothetical protein CKAN_00745500 [Cinnamomum micranthum f. kanehirae]|uniref:Uncharacterized protein n=1 Tax=Cinnamomum micranthum f. kanehirae TaxID=337451 RepID=A0A443NK91_9MAGN|nr:hypothetical protein CKAN_00745500 [Cinnamomum micranthum f. kanehirae]
MNTIETKDTSFDRSLKVSKSSRMLLCLFQIQSFNWLVDISHILSLNVRVLFSRANQLRKCCKQSFYPYARHVNKLPRNKCCRKVKIKLTAVYNYLKHDFNSIERGKEQSYS